MSENKILETHYVFILFIFLYFFILEKVLLPPPLGKLLRPFDNFWRLDTKENDQQKDVAGPPSQTELSNENAESLSLESPMKTDVTFLMLPGVYAIYHTESGFSYYGETACLIHRLNLHREHFQNQTIENAALREAFSKNPDISQIRFFVLDAGPIWADAKKRKDRERLYVEANQHRCFNILDQDHSVPLVLKPLMANGTRYESTRQAAKGEKVGRATIIRRLRNPNETGYYYLPDEVVSYGNTPLFGKKENTPSMLFSRMTQCVEAGFASNHQNIRRKIQRQEEGWRYAHFDKNGTPLRIPYTLKEGEISYEQWLHSLPKNE